MNGKFVIIVRRTFEGPRVRDFVLHYPDRRSPWEFASRADAEKKVRLLARIPYTLAANELSRAEYR